MVSLLRVVVPCLPQEFSVMLLYFGVFSVHTDIRNNLMLSLSFFVLFFILFYLLICLCSPVEYKVLKNRVIAYIIHFLIPRVRHIACAQQIALSEAQSLDLLSGLTNRMSTQVAQGFPTHKNTRP